MMLLELETQIYTQNLNILHHIQRTVTAPHIIEL